jgi:hypothetical protein
MFLNPHHHHWRDSPLWVLAFLRIVRHSSQFNATLLQFFTPKILMSCHTRSSHLNLGLPTFLAPSGLVLSTFLIILFSLARIMCPAHSSLFTYINPMMPGSLNSLYSSWLYLFLHGPFSSTGPKIYLRILRSKILNSLNPHTLFISTFTKYELSS